MLIYIKFWGWRYEVVYAEKERQSQQEAIEKTEKKLEEKKQELIQLCEENQEAFEAISEEMLAMLETDGKMDHDVTWEVAVRIGKQVKNPE